MGVNNQMSKSEQSYSIRPYSNTHRGMETTEFNEGFGLVRRQSSNVASRASRTGGEIDHRQSNIRYVENITAHKREPDQDATKKVNSWIQNDQYQSEYHPGI